MIHGRPFQLVLVMWLLLVGITAAAQNTTPILTGEVVHIRSHILNEDRTLFISKPNDYAKGTHAYPVLYLLDGQSQFRFVSAMVDFLAENERIPPMLVVAIDSGTFLQRTRDLTTPSLADIDSRFAPGNGGADKFQSFLSDELVPFVEKSYRTRPYRVLIGHSCGGLFAIHVLETTPSLFNALIAVDPTLSWNNGATVAEAELFFSRVKELPVSLFFTSADEGRQSGDIQRLASILDEKAPATSDGIWSMCSKTIT